MRSVDRLSSAFVAALCIAVLAGCSSAPLVAPEVAAAPVAAAPSPASAPASAPEPAPAPAEPEVVVTPEAQRAFDDARRAMRAGRTADAQRGFKSVIESHPGLGGPHANLGLLYRQAGKLPEAIAELELATKASPKQASTFNQLGITYRMHGQFAKAREAYERALDLDANHAAAVLNLGILNDLYLWDAKRALELYERYLALSPGGDATVNKWVADLKNRRPATAAAAAPARKEKE